MNKTLQQLFDEYVNEAQFSACLRPETIRGYKAVFILFMKVMPEVTSLESLTPEMLNEFFKRIKTRQRIVGRDTLKTGVKNSTIKTQYSKLNVFFVWLFKKGHIIVNPLKGIKRPRVSYDEHRRLNDDEVNKVYAAIILHSSNTFRQRRDTMMVSLLAFLGIRRGELASIKIKDIDLDKQEIIIQGATSKSGKSRTLHMNPTLVMHIKDYLKERNLRGLKTEYLVASSRGDRNLSLEGLKHWVESVEKKSGVKFHLHCFRHTFGCKLAEADVNLFKIQKMMGHSDVRITMRYARSLKTEDMGEDISKISF